MSEPNADALPIVFTGEEFHGVYSRKRLLAAAQFHAVRDLRDALIITREALQAVRPETVKRTTKTAGETTIEEVTVTDGGAPDWPTRQRAAEFIADLADVRRPSDDDRDHVGRPVSVSIVLSGEPRAALPAETVSISLGSPPVPPVVIDAVPVVHDAGGNGEVSENTGECR